MGKSEEVVKKSDKLVKKEVTNSEKSYKLSKKKKSHKLM